MEDIIMNTVRIKTYNEFVIGHYRNNKDILKRKDITDGQLISAVGQKKFFCIEDWYGNRIHAKFTISKIEKNEYGDYIYTISSNKDVPERYFPSPYEIIDCVPNIAAPIGYSIIRA